MKTNATIAVISLITIGGIWVKITTTPGEPARITSVTDGDTVRLSTDSGRQVKVRLACIDAPESGTTHGEAATRRLSELTPVGGKVQFVELGSGGWGRRAGELYTGIWPFYRNANRTLVAEGKAIVYPQYVSKCDRDAYWWDEKWARILRRGVQGDSSFCEPWLYRRDSCPAKPHRGLGYWWQSLWMNPWNQ